MFNNKVHSAIKTTPNERFFKDKGRVRNDSIVKIETLAYEVPHKFIGEHVKIKYYPDDQTRVFISHQDDLIECRLLNKEDNSKVKRHIDYSRVGEFNV